MSKEPVTMRTPFPAHQISKLPKPTKAQTDEVRADYTKGIRCQVCGGWHHPKVVHLDYVGHAALTDRLLDVDPSWSWEAVACDETGLPALDKDGGLWIRLTVNGVTRLGYGDAQGKTGGDAMKERIGDALRNAAMRFGAALDLWHKGDLHIEVEQPSNVTEIKKPGVHKPTGDIYASMDAEEQEYIRNLAADVIGMEAHEAVKFIEAEKIDNDEKVALWSLLPSNIRSAFKKASQELQAA